MKTKKTLILTCDEAKNLLATWQRDTLVNDPAATLEAILSMDGLYGFISDITKMGDMQIAEQIGELNLGEKLALENGADQVAVQVGARSGAYRLEVIWDMDNLSPDDRQQFNQPCC